MKTFTSYLLVKMGGGIELNSAKSAVFSIFKAHALHCILMILMFPALVSNVQAHCCPTHSIEFDASTETLSSLLSGNYYSGVICIKNGILLVDKDFTFENATILFDNEAGMEVQSGYTLTILESLLTACLHNGMWESVFVGDNATLHIEDSHIEQGSQAFYLTEEFSFTAIGNEFLNNLISVTVANVYTPNIYFEVHGNLFTADANFDASVYASNYDRPYMAFRLTNGYNINIGSNNQNAERNIIEKTYYGIWGGASNFTVLNTTFRDIVENSALTDAPGIAVFSRAFTGAPPYAIIGGPHPMGKAVLFEWCNIGIKADSSNLQVTHTFMNEVGDGIIIKNCQFTYVLIAENEALNERTYITIDGCDRANSIVIEDNLIGIGFVQNYENGLHGIAEFTTGMGHLESRMERNDIRFYSRYGIYMQGSKNWLIRDNVSSHSPEHIGTVSATAAIMLSGCTDMELYCNATFSGEYNITGISVIQSEGSKMFCNQTYMHNTGVFFRGSCLDTEFKGHFFDLNNIGLHLDESAVIGIQEHHGNLWMEPPYNPSARHDASDQFFVLLSQFIVGSQNYPLFAEQFQAVTNDWFFYDPSGGESYFKCEEEEELCIYNYGMQPLDLNENIYNELFATGYYSLDKHEAAQKLMHRQNLFNKLMTADNMQVLDYELDTFLTAGLYDERYQQYMRDLLLKVPVLSSSSFVAPTWHEQIVLALQGYETDWELDSLLLLMSDSYYEQTSNFESKLMAVAAYNQALAESEALYYYYSGTFYELLSKHYSDSLLEEDIALLYDIALQCPFDAGNAVYYARSLLRNYGFNLYLDDDLLCSAIEAMPQMQQMNEDIVSQYKIYPNPSSGKLIVEGEGEFTLKIYDLAGQLLRQSTLVSEKLEIQLDLPSGIYFAKITSLQGEVFTYPFILTSIER